MTKATKGTEQARLKNERKMIIPPVICKSIK